MAVSLVGAETRGRGNRTSVRRRTWQPNGSPCRPTEGQDVRWYGPRSREKAPPDPLEHKERTGPSPVVGPPRSGEQRRNRALVGLAELGERQLELALDLDRVPVHDTDAGGGQAARAARVVEADLL